MRKVSTIRTKTIPKESVVKFMEGKIVHSAREVHYKDLKFLLIDSSNSSEKVKEAFDRLRIVAQWKRQVKKCLKPSDRSLVRIYNSEAVEKVAKTENRFLGLYLVEEDSCTAKLISKRDYSHIPFSRKMKNSILNAWQDSKSYDIHLERSVKKSLDKDTRRMYCQDLVTSGGVYLEPNTFLHLYNHKLSRVLDSSKKPTTTSKHFGIEIEFFSPIDSVQKIKDELSKSKYRDYLSLGRDSSLNESKDRTTGLELRVCTPTEKLEAVVSFCSEVLKKHDCYVNVSCGLHVHLDARDSADTKKMFYNLLSQQASLYKLVPKSRRDNQYCRPTRKSDYGGRSSRYKSINSKALFKFGTIEVRLHSGTIDAEKIVVWSRLLAAIAYSEEDFKKSRTVSSMLSKLSTLTPEQKTFLLSRAEKFSGIESEEIDEESLEEEEYSEEDEESLVEGYSDYFEEEEIA